ncbi:MAG: protein kinase [Candidatus Obscuribacterales bacterium]|jgi:serine/threonine protein kinase
MESSDSTDAQVQIPEQHPSTGTSEPFSTALPLANQQANVQANVPANVQGIAQAADQTSDQAKIEIPGAFSPGAIIGASYEVIELLGRGAMGMVYKVKHVSLPTEYALKILTDDKHDEVSVIRFQNEAQAIAKLNHPNIVAIYNFGVHDGSLPFYVMDLLDGEDLLDKIVFSGPMTAEVALPLFIEASAGLSFAHRKGILHRDVKPANLLILDKPDVHGARVKVVDFGIVKFAEELKPEVQKLTAMGIVCGSPSYMSPEQAMGQRVDPRSDVYSLGCSLFEALTGKVPFRGRSASDTMMMHVSTPSPTLASKNPEGKFSDDLEMLVARMMAKEPMYRYQTMDVVAQDLRNVLDGKPLAAKPTFQPNLDPTQRQDQHQDHRFKSDSTSSEFGNSGEYGASGEYSTSGEYETSGDYAAADQYENADDSEDIDDAEDAEDEANIGTSKGKLIVFSLLALGVVGIVAFVALRFFAPSNTNAANLAASNKKIQVDLSYLSQGIPLEGDANPEPSAVDIKLPDTKYFSKIVNVNGKKMVQFDFPTQAAVRPLAFIGTSYEDKSPAWGKLQFPLGKRMYLVPTPDALIKPQFFSKFRHGEIDEIVLHPAFISEELVLASAKTPGIQGIDIFDCSGLSAKIVSALNSARELNSLTIFKSSITGADLAKASFWPNLKLLTLSHCVQVTPVLKELRGSRNLDSLDLTQTGIGPEDYKLIATMQKLENLKIDKNKVSAEDLLRLSNLSKLTGLSLVDIHCKDESIAKSIERFPSLKTLIVDRGHFKKQDLVYLNKHRPRLKVIYYAPRTQELPSEPFFMPPEQL